MPWSSASLEQGSKGGASDWLLLGLLQGTVSEEELMECLEGCGSDWKAYWRFSRNQLGGNKSLGPWVAWATGATVEVGETEFGTCCEGGLGGPCSLRS